MKLHVLHPNDRRTLRWMRTFEFTHERPPTAAEIANHRGWHRSSGVNFAKRMQQEGFLDERFHVLGDLD